LYRYGRDRPLVSLIETHLTARDLIYPTETREPWPRPNRLGREAEADGLLDRDQENLTETLETWPRRPRPWNPGRRPTHITVNAQTKVSEVNPSLRIR